MSKKEKKNSAKKPKFFEKLWVKATGLVVTISALIGIGVQIGIFKGDLDCKIERLEIIEEYQAKIESHKETCKAIKIGNLEDGVNDMNEIIDFLKKAKDEK